ncbi:hypothetical protein LXL04_030715 [Taraxacum kok-saghyz]
MVPGSNRVQSSEVSLWETGLLRMMLLSLRGGFELGFVACYGILPYRMSLPTTPNCRNFKSNIRHVSRIKNREPISWNLKKQKPNRNTLYGGYLVSIFGAMLRAWIGYHENVIANGKS